VLRWSIRLILPTDLWLLPANVLKEPPSFLSSGFLSNWQISRPVLPHGQRGRHFMVCVNAMQMTLSIFETSTDYLFYCTARESFRHCCTPYPPILILWYWGVVWTNTSMKCQTECIVVANGFYGLGCFHILGWNVSLSQLFWKILKHHWKTVTFKQTEYFRYLSPSNVSRPSDFQHPETYRT